MIAPNRYLVSYVNTSSKRVRNIIIRLKLNSIFQDQFKKGKLLILLTSDIPYYSIKKLNISGVIDKKFSTKCLRMTTVHTVMRIITILMMILK